MFSRDILIEEIRELFEKLSVERRLTDDLAQVVHKKHDTFPDEVIQYVIKIKDVNDIEEDLLFWIAEAAIEKNLVDVDLKNHFTDKEIEYYTKLVRKRENKNIYPVTISNILPVSYDQWVTTVDIDTLYEWYKNHFITYNPKTQRQLKKVHTKSDFYYTINVVKKSVNEIERAMKAGLFVPNDISLNINIDNPLIEYHIDEEFQEIVVEKGQLDLIDGYHRFLAAINVKIKNPDFKFQFIVNIMNFDEDKACNFIAQEDKRNPITKLAAKTMDGTIYSNLVYKRLNEIPDSYYYNKIGRPGMNEIDSVTLGGAVAEFFPASRKNRNYAMGLVKRINTLTNEVMAVYDLDLSKFGDLVGLIAASSITEDRDEAIDIIKYIKENEEFQQMFLPQSGMHTHTRIVKVKQIIKRRDEYV